MKAPAFLAPLLGPDADHCVLVNQRGEIIASKVRAAFDSASRKNGLLGRDGLEEGEALIIAPCNAVHMFFMRFAVDVVYLSSEGRVVKVVESLRPWRMSASVRGFATVEMAAGAAARRGIRRDDQVAVVPSPAHAEPHSGAQLR